jgi:16S rRNA (adenine1518-N6/adenine1519-N6)-dimethyltransferase
LSDETVRREAGSLRTPHSPFRTKKSLGQHFLKDRSVPPRIADAARLEPGDSVVEVGPGLGVLTEELARRLDPAQGGRLVAVELDNSLLPVLEEKFADRPHVSFVHADVLNVPPGDLSGMRPYKLVANLPYYITSAILRHFLEAKEKPQSLTVMVQREVAERMVARPPDMSLLAVAVQFYGKPKLVFRVPPGAFNPPPKVESAVVHIDVYGPGEGPVQPGSEASFFRVAQAGFGQKRKQLGNTLASGLGVPKETVASRLREVGIDPARRAETLSLEEWGRVERVLGPGDEGRTTRDEGP